MKFGSVCSGVEAASLAWMPLGWECKFVSEIEPFPCAVLQHRFGASAPINQLDPNEIIITDEEWALIDALKKVNKDWMKACDNADLISRFKERKQREAWIKDNVLLNKEGKIPNEGDFTKIGKKYAGQIDLLVGGTPCFVAGTMVLTPTGYVPIESLNVGDIVISGEGIERKVEAVGHKLADIGAMKILGRPEILCTENHPFMCFDVKRDNRRKSPTYSQNIPVGDFYKVPAGEAVGKYVGRVKVAPVAVAPLLPKVYDATAEQIMELAGWYLGDGYIRKWTGSNKKAVVFALCNQQKIDTFGERFGDALNYSISNDGKVTVACTALANWLSEQFGEHSENKRIPYWCYSHACKCALLRGYRSTDGCEQEKEYKFTTVSKALAYGMADMMGDASVTFTKTPDTATINGRTINQKDCYCVHFYKNTPVKTKKYKERYASKIRSFVYAGTDIVYNITVAEDHTYIANGIYVHNCQDLSIAGKRAGFDGERSSLALDFVRLAYESQCKWFVWENVPGVFSSNEGRDFATLLSLFTGSKVEVPKDGWGTAGFVCNARRDRYGVAWRTLDGQFTRTQRFPFAVPQRRRRVFVVGYFGDWTRAAEVLLEPGRSKWDTPSRFKAREIFAEIARADSALADRALRGTGKGSTECLKANCDRDRMPDKGKLPCVIERNEVAAALTASYADKMGLENQHTAVVTPNGEDLSDTLNASYYKGVGTRNGNERTVVCKSDSKYYQWHSHSTTAKEITDQVSPTLQDRMGEGGASMTTPLYISEPICTDAQGGSVMSVETDGNAGMLSNEQIVCGDLVQTLKIRSGCEGGGKGALVQDELSATLGCGNDQTLFVVHGAQTPINNEEEYANPLGCCNDGLENVISSMHNKQFGQCEENLASTLLSTDYKEPQIVCYDNHANDSRITESNEVSPLSRAGTGGGNLPLVQECYEWHSQDLRAKKINDDCGATISAGMGMGGANMTTPMLVHECYAVDKGNQTLDAEISNTLNTCTGGDNYGTIMQECYAIDSMGSNAMKSSNPYSGFHKEEIAKTLDTTDPNPTKNQGGNVIVDAVAIAENIIGRADHNGGNGVGAQEELAYTQNATGVMGVCQSTVRRLLPIETERLMGFPDNHTRIPWKGLKEEDCPDSPRYKACGNSMCVNVMQWIGEQIDKVEKRK